LPDLLFVRSERQEIVRERAVYGAPDLVIEIVSPNDRASDLIALETEYRGLGVPEILFLDLPRQRVRALRRGQEPGARASGRDAGGSEYAEEVCVAGVLRLGAIEGMALPVQALLRE